MVLLYLLSIYFCAAYIQNDSPKICNHYFILTMNLLKLWFTTFLIHIRIITDHIFKYLDFLFCL